MTDRLTTERLILRRWTDDDREPFADLNADPEVMRYFPNTLTKVESDALVDRIEQGFATNGFGLWAVEEKGSNTFIGYIGIAERNHDGISFMPCLEIGWRLYRDFWGHGYATEGAHAVMEYAASMRELTRLFSYTSRLNEPSINVMRKIGLTPRPELDFDHPEIEVGHPLRPHVVYSN
jgi:RimJ/RimL family protein N-acetyltransferase